MSKDAALISIVIPAYNSEKTILRAIHSILKQTRVNFIKEIIIIDDGSTDSTSQIIKEFIIQSKPKTAIKLIKQENAGVSAARNNGVKIAKGEWIALLDADDAWVENKIELSIKAISEHPIISVLGSNRDKLLRKRGRKVAEGLYRLNVRDQLWSYWPSTPTLMFKKEIIDSIGGYDETRSHAEDGDFLLRAAANYGVYYLSESLTITDDKPAYGASGLSGNNQKMHEGCLINVRNALKRSDITLFEARFFIAWENIKYIRRQLITALRRN